jgi:4-diphosphocytidyl-2-C-methyl-D-erythritol kinase
MKKISLPSYAKINLYLEALRRRPDQYHDIKTIYQAIDLKDTLTLSLTRENEIKITSDSKKIPTGAANLAYQAALAVIDKTKVKNGLHIKIEKKIPVAAGLGGGSSNAASCILGLNKLLNLKLKKKEMLNIAGSIGSDVPFFILEESSALGALRGGKLKRLKKIPDFFFLLVCPELEISSQWAYSKLKLSLTKKKPGVKMCIRALRSGNIERISRTLYNDLESVVLSKYSEVRRIKNRLIQAGVKAVLVSGSGPCVFGIFKSREEAMSTREKLGEREGGWATYICGSR